MNNPSVIEVLNKIILSIRNNPEDWEVEACGYFKKIRNIKNDIYLLFDVKKQEVDVFNLQIKSSSFKIPSDIYNQINEVIKNIYLEREKQKDEQRIKEKTNALKRALTI